MGRPLVDVAESTREGNAIPDGATYRILINDTYYTTDDPILTGRQVASLAGLHPVEEFLVFYFMPEGRLEDISLEETVDLRTAGVECFYTFRNDRSFRFELDGTRQDWGAAKISGATLLKLAGVGPDHDVFLELRDEADKMVGPRQMIDLGAEGVERFYTKLKEPVLYELVINAKPYILNQPYISYEELVQHAYPGSQSEGDVSFDITYRHAASMPHSGTLGPGGTIEVKQKGTVVNVTRCIKS